MIRLLLEYLSDSRGCVQFCKPYPYLFVGDDANELKYYFQSDSIRCKSGAVFPAPPNLPISGPSYLPSSDPSDVLSYRPNTVPSTVSSHVPSDVPRGIRLPFQAQRQVQYLASCPAFYPARCLAFHLALCQAIPSDVPHELLCSGPT